MSEESSDTYVVCHLQMGEAVAQQKVWAHYYGRLTVIARAVLRRRGARLRVADEEDVVLSVFDSVFRRAKRGEYPNLSNRSDLWRLLLVVTKRKVANLIRNESAQKRGGGHVRRDFVRGAAHDTASPAMDRLALRSPPGMRANALMTSVEELLESADGNLKKVAVLRLQGYKNTEIAERLGCSLATIERRMARIRELLCKTNQHELKDPMLASVPSSGHTHQSVLISTS
jgi:DNA-directed RNA polymerase specialized sigma24 family protein